jgi:hypothetical protein
MEQPRKDPDYRAPEPDKPEKPKEKDPPKVIEQPPQDPPPVRDNAIIVKRRQQLDAEALRRELAKMRELHVDSVPQSSTRIVTAATNAKKLNQKYPGPLAFLGKRDDLAGLPMTMGPECHLGKEPAENMQVLSRKLRVLLEMSIPKDGIETRPDPVMLRALLMEGKPAQGAEGFEVPAVGAPAIVRAGRFGRVAVEGRPQDWLTPESVPVLMQMLQAENTAVRRVLVDVLGAIKGKAATEALANRALMDLAPDVRETAVEQLKKRRADDYQAILLKAMKYPWAPVADHAAEAMVALGTRDAVPQLIHMLAEPEVTLPITVGKGISAYQAVREVVRLNHLGNCVLCHAPSMARTDMVRGAVPTPGQALPAPVTTPQYYEGNGQGVFVRADITYLRQDFSVVQQVERHGQWPEFQRFDYMVRTRPVRVDEVSAIQKHVRERKHDPHREAMLFALRELTGKDLGKTAQDWATLLPPGQEPGK